MCNEIDDLTLSFVEPPLKQLFLVVLLLMLDLDFGNLIQQLFLLLD